MYQIAFNLGDAFFGGSNPLDKPSGVATLVYVGVSNAIVIAGLILIITIIYAGISMISASGDVQQFERARLILTSAILGFVIIVAAWFIVKAIQTSTGTNFLG
jgi:hypothetical protein